MMTAQPPVLIAAALSAERAALEAIAVGLQAHTLPGIAEGDLLVDVKVLDTAEMAALMDEMDVMISF